MTPSKPIAQAKNAERSRKTALQKIHRIVDAYEDSGRHCPFMEQIKATVGRKQKGEVA